MKIVDFNASPSLEDALSALDAIRDDLKAGNIVAFAAAGVGSDDTSFWYCGSSRPVTRLRLIGAMSKALFHFQMGD